MKKLTQSIFKDAPIWARSAAINSNGQAGFFDRTKDMLDTDSGRWGYRKEFQTSTLYNYKEIAAGFDSSDWENSAINREFTK